MKKKFEKKNRKEVDPKNGYSQKEVQCRAILVNVIRTNDDNNSINSINRQLKKRER